LKFAGRSTAGSLGDLESAIVRVDDDEKVGTGFFIDAGLILTCAHVVPSKTVLVTMPDGREVAGDVVCRAPEQPRDGFWPAPDLALIEVPPTNQSHFRLAPPDAEVGEELIAAGFVVGPDPTRTLTYEKPVVSATEPVDGLRVLKLGQCQLEPGMSGAPLIDADTRQVVGIVKRSRKVDARAGGWAVPIAAADQHFPDRTREIRDENVADAIHDYYSALIGLTKEIEPRGMPRNLESQDIVFPLDDVYLSLEMQRFHEADFVASQGRSADAASAEPYLGVERVPDAPQLREAASLSRILAEGRCTVLLGDAGSGKTTLLQWIALNAARARDEGRTDIEVEARQIDPESTSDETVKLTSARLPISVRLAGFHERLSLEAEAGRGLSLRDFLVMSVCELAGDGGGCLKEHVNELIDRGEAIVLLDGMDELREMSHRKEVRDAITAFAWELAVARAARGSGSPLGVILQLEDATNTTTIVVTSRRAGYRDASLPTEAFEHGLIAPLSDGAVSRFLLNWNLAVRKWSRGSEETDSDVSAEAKERADAIAAQLHSSPNLREIARTPLLLTVVTLVHDEREKLPQKRTELLLQMGEILVERRVTGHRFNDAADLLGPVALWLHRERATGLLTRDELMDRVRENFHRAAIVHPEGATPMVAMVERFCVDAEEQFGLIVERGSGLVGFQHRMLQEFFAALDITSWEKDPFGAIEAHLFDPQWREVIIFAAYFEARKGAQIGTSFLNRLLVAGGDDEEQVERRRQALFLSADCLAETNRSLLEIEVAVISGLVELICTSSTTSPADGVREAIGRLRTIARLFPETTDAVLTRNYQDAEVPVRRTLCEIAVEVGIEAPGLKRALEKRDGEPGVCLSERIALLALRGQSPEPGEDLPDAIPEWIQRTQGRLRPYGDSAPRQALESMQEALLRDGDEAKDQYRDKLVGLLESCVGIDATLAGIALTTVRPDATDAAFATLVARNLPTEAADLLIWSARNTQLATEVLEQWGELNPHYRGYVLALLARDPNGKSARDVAWAEIEFTATEEVALAQPSQSQHLYLAMLTLLAARNLRLSPSQFEWLDELAFRDAEIEATVALLLSGARLEAETRPHDLQAQSMAGLHFLTVLMAENGDLSENVLIDIVRASDHPSGVWSTRTARALRKSRNFSDLSGRVVRTVEETLGSETLPRTHLTFEAFANLVMMDMPVEVARLVDGETSPFFFSSATAEVDELLLRATVSAAPGHERALGALYGRRGRGSGGLPLCDVDSPEIEVLLASDDEGEAVLGGALLARAARESKAAAKEAIDLLMNSERSPWAALEFCFWVSEERIPIEDEIEAIADRVIETWPGEFGMAVAARLLATTPDNGHAFLSRLGTEDAELIEAILTAGDHPISWTTASDQPTLRGLSSLMVKLSEDPETFDTAVAVCAEVLRSDCDWPRTRFTLHQLAELGSRAVDGFAVSAVKHGLVAATAPHLGCQSSFGVRARAFVVLALAGRFDEKMFDALVGGALDINEVSMQIFESLRLIRSVDDAVVNRIRQSLESQGVEAIAAIDAALQLLHSFAMDGDSSRRGELVEMLAHAASVCSPWAVCRLPSGLGLPIRPSIARAVNRVMTNTDQVGQMRPIMLTVPQTTTRTASRKDADRTFTEYFLARARQHLATPKGDHAQDR
jgi:hypothetical protein